MSDSYFFGAKIKVCVTSLPPGWTRMRLSWDPWRLNGSLEPGSFEAGADPWWRHDAPNEGYYRVGQCLSGWLPFAVSGTKTVTRVSYANSLGDAASWRITTGQTPQRRLGTTARFPSFAVTLTQAKQDELGFRAYAKVCVTKLPQGSANGNTRVSWAPWGANAGQHFDFAPSVNDASHTASPLYPQSKLLRVGQCAQGWVPFEEGVLADRSLVVDRISYLNSLGNKAFWTVLSP